MTTTQKITAMIRARDVAENLMVSFHMDGIADPYACDRYREAQEHFMKLADALGYKKPVLKGGSKP